MLCALGAWSATKERILATDVLSGGEEEGIILIPQASPRPKKASLLLLRVGQSKRSTPLSLAKSLYHEDGAQNGAQDDILAI